MNSLDWLTGHRFQELKHREYDWVLVFNDKAVVVVSCVWRLLEGGRIRRTSSDHGQQFGLPAPVDAASDVNRLLRGASVEEVQLNGDTLDFEVRFSSGHVFQVLPDSSGYEAWMALNGTNEFIAVGGGRLEMIPARQT